MGVSVKVDLSRAIKKLSQNNINRGRYTMSNQMLADMNQFIPAKDYHLRGTGHVSFDGSQLIWNTPYAAKMFYVQFSKYTTSGTGPRWDLKGKSLFMNDWIRAFKKGASL